MIGRKGHAELVWLANCRAGAMQDMQLDKCVWLVC